MYLVRINLDTSRSSKMWVYLINFLLLPFLFVLKTILQVIVEKITTKNHSRAEKIEQLFFEFWAKVNHKQFRLSIALADIIDYSDEDWPIWTMRKSGKWARYSRGSTSVEIVKFQVHDRACEKQLLARFFSENDCDHQDCETGNSSSGILLC